MADWGTIIDDGAAAVRAKDAAYRTEIDAHEGRRLSHRADMNGIIGRQAGVNALLQDEIIKIISGLNPDTCAVALERARLHIADRSGVLERHYWNDPTTAERHLSTLTT